LNCLFKGLGPAEALKQRALPRIKSSSESKKEKASQFFN
jgi:hypothetical protein